MAGSFEPKADTEIIGRAGGMQVRVARSQPELEVQPVSETASAPRAPENSPHKLLRLLAESAVVTAMTLCCLAVFILILSLSFPQGHDLRELLRSNRDPAAGLGAFRAGRGGDSTATTGNSMATLSVVRASVHTRSAGSIAWGSAPSGLGLQAGDGIQTGAAGTAELNFKHGNVRLEKNSLVILGGGTEVSELLARSPRSLTVVRGDLFAKLDDKASEGMRVILPRGIAQLRPVAGSKTGSPAKFRISTGSDRSSALTVLSGSLALEANGKTVSVGPGQFSRIGGDGAPSDPLTVPEAPVVLSPAPGSRFAYLDLPPVVPFRWESSNAGDGTYRVRATRGPKFMDEVVSQATADSFLNWGRFVPGTYEWQVTRVVNGVEGIPSAPRRLVIEQAGGPIALVVEPLPKRVSRLELAVRGKARPGAAVFVMGHPARVHPDGTFELEISLSAGVNVVLVEAVDAAGNSTYSSQVVYAAN